ncbi:hypothetical protein [Nocardioides sp. Kera G14]|uniref:hypothetical protein n=1 Tax=Nocardioides sp. Kera G14 TaxID=2884264 RepID=UPI001D12D621|nr:hypothetical protein [Nocardioides sp. Kera G14]UDY23936.1 hypothetical protein LH076_01150 [Nocardioides sp. Kera G14]
MYSDLKPCRICGSDVELRPHQTDQVAEPDGTPDDRVCMNPDCPSHTSDEMP